MATKAKAKKKTAKKSVSLRVPNRNHSKVESLPKALLKKINDAILKKRITYKKITQMVDDWVANGKIPPKDAPSKTGIQRHGRKLQERVAGVLEFEKKLDGLISKSVDKGLVLPEVGSKLAMAAVLDLFDKAKTMQKKDLFAACNAIARMQTSDVKREQLKDQYAKDLAKRKDLAKKAIRKSKIGGKGSREKLIEEIDEILGL